MAKKILFLVLILLCCGSVFSAGWTDTGLCGGGAMFTPAISPFDKNLIFIACDMSGVYRSTDGGNNWTLLDRHKVCTGSGSAYNSFNIVFHPTDANKVYLYGSNGPWSAALMQSNDKGDNWSVLAPSSTFGDNILTAFYINRGDTNIVYAADITGKVYRSTNGGTIWSSAVTGLTGRVFDFVIDQRSSGKVYAGTSSGVYASSNGTAFTLMATSPTTVTSFAGGSTGSKLALYCVNPTDKKVYVSVNDGAWSAVSGGIGSENHARIVCADQFPDTAYVSNWDDSNIYKTTTTGGSWSNVMTGSNATNGWTWYDESPWWGGFFCQEFLGDLSICQGDPNYLIGTTLSDAYLTTDGGANWHSVHGTYSDSGARAANKKWANNGLGVTTTYGYYIDPNDSKKHYICYTDIGFARSTDSGATWISSFDGSPWVNTFYQMAFDPDTPGTLYAAVTNQHDLGSWPFGEANSAGGAVKSIDYGANWTAICNGLPNNSAICATCIVIDPSDKSLYIGMYGDGVYKSTDHGASWTKKSSGLGIGSNNHVYGLKVDSQGYIYCLITGKNGANPTEAGGIWKSTDKGNTWNEITAAAAGAGRVFAPINFEIHPSDPKTIYMTAFNTQGSGAWQGGVYKTINGGTSWSKLSTPSVIGSGTPYVYGIAINPSNPKNMYYGTMCEGLFISNDAGVTWKEDTTYPFSYPNRIFFDAEGTVYVTSYGSSVLKYSVGVLPPGPVGGDSVKLVCYPNPCRMIRGAGKSVRVSNVPTDTSLEIYGGNGELIRVLKSADFGNSGTILWDGKNSAGQDAAQGIYSAVAVYQGGRATRKIALLR